MENYKRNTNKKLLDIYKVKGLKYTISLAETMLKVGNHKKDKVFRNSVHGEICETVLECCILEFLKEYKQQTVNWFYEKGLILKDPERKNNYFTELDITLFTGYKVLAFECKSYGGPKTFTDECKVSRPNFKTVDVYKQHRGHYITLMKNIKWFKSKTDDSKIVAPFKIAYFDFSIGSIVDKRDNKWKDLMPIITVKNVQQLLVSNLNKPIHWDLKGLKKAVELIVKNKEENTKKHLDFVTSLRSRK